MAGTPYSTVASLTIRLNSSEATETSAVPSSRLPTYAGTDGTHSPPVKTFRVAPGDELTVELSLDVFYQAQ